MCSISDGATSTAFVTEMGGKCRLAKVESDPSILERLLREKISYYMREAMLPSLLNSEAISFGGCSTHLLDCLPIFGESPYPFSTMVRERVFRP